MVGVWAYLCSDDDVWVSWRCSDEEVWVSWWRSDEEVWVSWWRSDEEVWVSWWRSDEPRAWVSAPLPLECLHTSEKRVASTSEVVEQRYELKAHSVTCVLGLLIARVLHPRLADRI